MARQSIFGSGAERTTFLSLQKKWGREVDVFPQVPVKCVVGYDLVQALQNEEVKKYLLQTEFDYVVCRKKTGAPILVIEFDGIGGGFSRLLEYKAKVVPISDPNRARTIESKLGICADAEIPIVVVSV